jgi:hypothetical protein
VSGLFLKPLRNSYSIRLRSSTAASQFESFRNCLELNSFSHTKSSFRLGLVPNTLFLSHRPSCSLRAVAVTSHVASSCV